MPDVLSEHDRSALTVLTETERIPETESEVRSAIRGPPSLDSTPEMP